MKDIPNGEKYFRLSVEANPSNIPVWINLANVLTEEKDVAKKKEALEIYKKYQSQTPKAFKLDSLIPALEAELKK